MISSLLHLVDLQPQVYYTVTNFRGGGGVAMLPCPSPLNTPMLIYNVRFTDMYCTETYNMIQTYDPNIWSKHMIQTYDPNIFVLYILIVLLKL